MRTLIYILFLCFIISCGDQKTVKSASLNSENDSNKSDLVDPKIVKYDSVISLLPNIDDTALLIEAIIKKYNLENGARDGWTLKETITTSSTIAVGKQNDSLTLLEYDFDEGCSAAYPWKYQLFLEPNSTKLIKRSTYESFRIIDIDGEKMILAKNESGKGYGSHEILRFEKDSFVNTFDHNHYLSDNETYNPVSTVDCHSDDGYYPKPLDFKKVNINNDNYTDIQFSGFRKMVKKKIPSGQWVDIEPYEKRITFNYIYNPSLDKFIPEEDYEKRYSDLY